MGDKAHLQVCTEETAAKTHRGVGPSGRAGGSWPLECGVLRTDIPMSLSGLAASVKYVPKRSRGWKQLGGVIGRCGEEAKQNGAAGGGADKPETLRCCVLEAHVSGSCKMLLNCMKYFCSDQPRLTAVPFVSRVSYTPGPHLTHQMPGTSFPSNTSVSSGISPLHPKANTHLIPKLLPFCPRKPWRAHSLLEKTF